MTHGACCCVASSHGRIFSILLDASRMSWHGTAEVAVGYTISDFVRVHCRALHFEVVVVGLPACQRILLLLLCRQINPSQEGGV